MLEILRIKNLALIEDMEIEFSDGMNVLTGETGAGKSFILRALNFIMGEKLSANMVRSGAERAQVEALFILPDGERIVRRELSAATGRSRLYINDKLSSQESIKELQSQLIVHTSQHEQQKLLQPAFQAQMLDSYMERPDLLSQREELLQELQTLAAERQRLTARTQELSTQREFLEYQQQEIAKVAPEANEEQTLEERKKSLRGQLQSKEKIEGALELLGDYGGALLANLGELERVIQQLGDDLPEYAEDVAQVNELRLYMGDLQNRLRHQPSNKGGSDSELEDIESRLYDLAQLKRKLRRSLDEIVALQQEIDENLSFLDSCGLDLKQLAKKEHTTREALAALLSVLTPARKDAGTRLARALEEELKGLGFSEHLRIEFSYTPVEIAPQSAESGVPCIEERAHLLWIPNPGQAPQALERIASGGELSRFLLAWVSLVSRTESATLLFDEVDAGVGGLTLNSVATRLERLATDRQMLLITHWPQLAVRGSRHFYVHKEVENDYTYTRCEQLSADAVREELCRMAGGGAQGKALAAELLAQKMQ